VERKRRYFQTSLTESTFALGAAKRSILPNVLLKREGEQKPPDKKPILFHNCYTMPLALVGQFRPVFRNQTGNIRCWAEEGYHKGIPMKRFEYEITKHPAGEFSHLTYFCSETGECSLDQVPEYQTKRLREIMNKKGSEGWELVQISFGTDGIVAFWKRMIK
jgi:hypothetical protein